MEARGDIVQHRRFIGKASKFSISQFETKYKITFDKITHQNCNCLGAQKLRNPKKKVCLFRAPKSIQIFIHLKMSCWNLLSLSCFHLSLITLQNLHVGFTWRLSKHAFACGGNNIDDLCFENLKLSSSKLRSFYFTIKFDWDEPASDLTFQHHFKLKIFQTALKIWAWLFSFRKHSLKHFAKSSNVSSETSKIFTV